MTRVRYQFGSLELVRGIRQDVWTFRFYELCPDGKRRYKRIRVGTKAQYPTEATALMAAEALRLSVNTGNPVQQPVLFDVVIERYLREELPLRFSTRTSYSSLLKKYIQPKWGSVSVIEFRPLEIEHWLKSRSLAPNTKSHIRNLMHLLFEWARRWEIVDRNPIELVRQGKQRQKTPRRLTAEEFQKLLGPLCEPCRAMAIVAACLGLRIGEILGLQWGDVDFLKGTLVIRRSVYQYHVGPAKTAYSESSLPLAPEIISVLQCWFSQAAFRADTDWIFASEKGGLRDGDKLRERMLQTGADRAEIGKIGWRTLRHSFATALDTAGARMKVAQELMRHANISTTMDVYTGATERDKWAVAAQVARCFLGRVQ